MKKNAFLIFFILTLSNCIGQIYSPIGDPSNCEYPFEFCTRGFGASDGFNQDGYGLKDSFTASCITEEHNSLWYKITFKTDGTFGFELKPWNNYGRYPEYADVDYDFAVFGPNANCGNLGTAIRCSATNSKLAKLNDTYTGMNGSEIDTSEGPGANGNSYVKWIDVKAGESYYVLIDVIEKALLNRRTLFSLDVTGTAEIEGRPNLIIPTGTTLNLEQCDTDGTLDFKTNFNLTQNTSIVIGNQTNVDVDYYTNINDANQRVNAIPNPETYANITNPAILYLRMENKSSLCNTVTQFTITVVDNNAKFTTTQSAICDDALDANDSNGKATFDFKKVTTDILGNIDITGLTILYYLTKNEALLGINPLPNLYYNATPNQQSVFVTVSGANYCSKEPQEIHLIVNSLPAKSNYILTQCEVGTNPDGLTLYNLKEADLALTNNDANLSVQYFLNPIEEANNNPLPYNYTNSINPQQITVRITNKTTSCSSLGTLTLKTKIINEAPILLQECDILGQENGFAVFNLNDANLELSSTQTLKYYPTLNDALLEEKDITNFANYTNKIAYSESVFARVEDDNSCYGIIEIQLKINTLPNIIIEEEDFLCANIPNDIVLLDANLISGNPFEYSYKWFRNGQPLPQTTYGIQAVQTGTYTVEVTNSDKCSKTRTITVAPSSTTTTIDVNITDVTTEFNSVSVLVSGIGKYTYSLDQPTGPFQSSALFENVTTGIHELYVYDENGCGITSKTIAVIGIPKFFTPNADGYNDVWKIKGVDAIFNVATTIFIFDRYGKLLKQIPIGNYDGWDGIYNEKPLPADDYWYSINLVDGRIVKGHFALKR